MVFHQNWIRQADAHWKEFQPTRYAALKESGQLKGALQQAADQTSLEMGQLTDSGYRHDEAWEMTREQYLFPPEEVTAQLTVNIIDDPGAYQPLEIWEQHLEVLKALPKTDMTRDLQIRHANWMIATKRNEAKASKKDIA